MNYNVAPTQKSYVITDQQPDRLSYYTWGLLPYWSRDGKVTGRLINARSEGIAGKPSFRVPIRRRRCWVLADSFYEWIRRGNQKIPYRILPKSDELLVMAGIWDVWKKGEEEIRSFSILTTPPNREMSHLHNRMPLVLSSRDIQEHYLFSEDLDEVLDLLHTPPDGVLDYYRVSQKVNSYRNNSPELHKPVEENLS